MNSPDALWPQPVCQVLATLRAKGFSAYLVGGCVRDRLRGKAVNDYDIGTSALPTEVIELFGRTIPTGIRHGTVTVILEGLAIEITTLRRESYYSDGRHPDAVEFGATIEEDLARRDFTINAMAIDREGQLLDPYGGRLDLHERIIRAVGDPWLRFEEDGLRILRALRFAAVLGFHIEATTYLAMTELSHRIERVATERIGQEFAKMSQVAWWNVLNLLSTGAWLNQLPKPWPKLQLGFYRLGQIPQLAPQIDALMKNLDVTTAGPALSQRQCASAALWGYTSNLTDGENRQWLLSMAWDKHARRLIEETVELLKQDPLNWNLAQWRKAFLEFGQRPIYLACVLLDMLSLVDPPVAEGPARDKRVQRFSSLIQTQPLWRASQLSISGHQIANLGARGAQISRIQKFLLEAVLQDQVANQSQTLIEVAKLYIRREQCDDRKG